MDLSDKIDDGMKDQDAISALCGKMKADKISLDKKSKMVDMQFNGCWTYLNFGKLAPVNMVESQYILSKRAYHNIDHIWTMLNTFMAEWPDMSSEDRAKLVIAIVMHDMIYEVGSTPANNEAASAQLLPWFVSDMTTRERLVSVGEIMQAIMGTTHDEAHKPPQKWQQYLLDLDLHELGADWGTFHANTGKVRAEFARYSDAEWNEGRLKFWSDLTDRERIFYNPFELPVYTELEKVARQNIAKEMAMIESAGKPFLN